ncbi:MAG: hypothetical protein K0R66_1270 [Gammaproteobacteria bacterium]|jgi:opacity protein-like surface antigen|nr:hypothetical protein [Gammaproteobacteria bacterium]
MKQLTILATTLALGLSSTAFAVVAQSGPYISGAGGWSFASDPNSNGVTESHKNYTWSANLGYDYALNPNVLVGAEIGYLNFGKTTYTGPGTYYGQPANVTAQLKNDGYQIMATATYLANNGLSTFVKAGAINQKTDLTEDTTLSNVWVSGGEGDIKKWIPATVVGVGYALNPNLNLALQWEHTFGENYNSLYSNNAVASKPMTQDAVTLGLSYKFGA